MQQATQATAVDNVRLACMQGASWQWECMSMGLNTLTQAEVLRIQQAAVLRQCVALHVCREPRMAKALTLAELQAQAGVPVPGQTSNAQPPPLHGAPGGHCPLLATPCYL